MPLIGHELVYMPLGSYVKKNRLKRAYFGGFCYEVFPTLSRV